MRRFSGLLTTFSLLAVMAAGCHHTAGVCDCDYRSPLTTGTPVAAHPLTPTNGAYQGIGAYPVLPGRPAEELKELPKPKDKDKPEPPMIKDWLTL